VRRKWFFASTTIRDVDVSVFNKNMHGSGDLTITREVKDGITANIGEKVAAYARRTGKSYDDAAALILERYPNHARLWRCKVAPPGQADVFVLATEESL
jgi:hypothetical protein